MRWVGWLINGVYVLVVLAASPLVAWRLLVKRKPIGGWRTKLTGQLPVRTDFSRPMVWLHAVSVGEVLLLPRVINRLRQRSPDLQFVVTTTTVTGHAIAREKLDGCTVTWLPFDFSWAVRAALSRVRPDLLVLAELELWPNLILAAGDAGVPLALVNGRMGDRSFRGYRLIRPLVCHLLQRFRSLAVQTEMDARRFEQLGAPPGCVVVTGSIKFDGVEMDPANRGTQSLRALLDIHPQERVLVIGSTQAPEEKIGLEVWMRLRTEFSNLRLVLVPRHPERFEEVAALVRKAGLPLRRRTRQQVEGGTGERPVVLLDTVGELAAAWGLADVAFVGGSLTRKRGGQNMIEPAAYGAAVLFGPFTRNFRSIVESLLSRGAARVVRNKSELYTELHELLINPARQRRMGLAARSVVLSGQGATARTVDCLVPLLPPQRRTLRRAA